MNAGGATSRVPRSAWPMLCRPRRAAHPKRNPIAVFMCIELMLNAVNIVFVSYGRFLNSEEGWVFAFRVTVVAAAEVVVGLALITQGAPARSRAGRDDLDEMSE